MSSPTGPRAVAPKGQAKPGRRRKVTDSQRRVAAHLTGAGASPEAVCDQLGISREQYKYMQRKRDFQEWRDSYLEQLAEAQASHRLRYLEQNHLAYEAHMRNLLDDDGKVRLQAVRDHFQHAGLAPTEAPSATVNVGEVHVSAAQQTVNVEVAEKAKEVLQELPDLLRAAAAVDPNKHVRTGEEALPQALLAQVGEATRRAEIEDADIIPAPTEEPSS